VSDQVSDPCKTTGKIIVLYISVFIFLDNKLEDRIIARIPWLQSAPSVFLNRRTRLGFIHRTYFSILWFSSDLYWGKNLYGCSKIPIQPTLLPHWGRGHL